MEQLSLDTLIKPFADLAFIIDQDYKYCDYWASDVNLLFVPPEFFLNKSIAEVLGNDFAGIFTPLIDRVFSTGISEEIEYQSPDGNSWFRAIISNYGNTDVQNKYVSIYSKDITEDKKIRRKTRLFENIITNNWDAIVFADLKGTIEYVNPAAINLYGYSGKEFIGMNVSDFYNSQQNRFYTLVKTVLEHGYWMGEVIHLKKDHSPFNALLSVQLIRDENQQAIGYVSFSKDIRNELETAKKLKDVINEKDELLLELHHRIKNNLSIIKGLLKLKSDEIRDPADHEIIRDYLNRIDALAMITNSLYVQDKLNEHGFEEFLLDLKKNIYTLYSIRPSVQFKLDIAHFIIPFNQVIPFGLIVNEVITNSLKHAFTHIESPKIELKLEKHVDYLMLTIEDNGKGFDLDNENCSFGMNLIDGLVDQIDGNYHFETENGTKFTLQMPVHRGTNSQHPGLSK